MHHIEHWINETNKIYIILEILTGDGLQPLSIGTTAVTAAPSELI